MKIDFKDKFLPHQKDMALLYKGNNFEYDVYSFINKYSDTINPYEIFHIDVPGEFSQEEMGSNPVNLSFLNSVLLMLEPKTILEIGTFVGAATMVFASVNQNVKVVTIEKYKKFADIALGNFKKNNFNNISLINEDALNVVKNIEDNFDVVFIDGNKENYLDYFNYLKNKMNRNGIIIVDDIFFHGDVLTNPLTEKGKGVKRLLDELQKTDFIKTIVPVSNGMLIIQGF